MAVLFQISGFYLKYKLFCQKPAHSYLPKWLGWAAFFKMFIVFGMYNFVCTITGSKSGKFTATFSGVFFPLGDQYTISHKLLTSELCIEFMRGKNPTIFNIIRWVNGTNDSLTKRLMFQVLYFFFHNFLQNSLQKSFQFIFYFFITLQK